MAETKVFPVAKALVTRTRDDGTDGQGAGAHTHLLVGRQGDIGTRRNYDSLIEFTTNWTGVGRIVSAVLTLTTDDLSEFGPYTSGKTPTILIRRLTSGWTEGSSAGFVSGDYEKPSYTTSGQKKAVMSKVPSGVTNIDITDIVKAWAPASAGGSGSTSTADGRNKGIGLYGYTDGSLDWGGWSDDHGTPGERPFITLTYELGPTTPDTPVNLAPTGIVPSITAFAADFNDARATDYLKNSQVQVYAANGVKSGDADTDNTIDVTAHGFSKNQEVWFHSLTGGAGLYLHVPYYVKSVVSANSFTVSRSVGGTTVDITDAYSALTVGRPTWSILKPASETERVNARSNVLPEGFHPARNVDFKWRIRQQDQEGKWSLWTALATTRITNDDPNAPSGLTPDGLSFASLNGVIFRAGTFSDPNAGDRMLAFQCQMSAELPSTVGWDDATNIVWDTGKRYVAAGTDIPETPYGGADLAAGDWYWRIRWWDQNDGLSDWSYAVVTLTADFNAEPGSQDSIQHDPNAPWRIRIREMKFNSLAAITGAITGSAGTDTFTCAKNHGLAVGQKVRFASITGGTGLVVGMDYYVISSGFTSAAFKVSATLGGTAVNFTSDVTAAVLTSWTTRGPGNVVAIIEDAKSVGASIIWNSPGEAHWTLPVDYGQMAVIEPKMTHYGIDFYTGDGWRETYAGLVWDMNANETDVVFVGMDYLGLTDAVSDERYDPASPDKSYTKGGSKYVDVSIRTIVIDQLTRATKLANSPVGFISIGSIATMNEKVTIWSTMQPSLAFITGLLDSHRQGTGKKTRLSVRRTSAGGYEYVVEDDPGIARDNLRLRYGELVNGYQVVLFGDEWSNVAHGIGRTREGIRVLYKTANSPGISQRIWGRFARATILDNVSDENDAMRRTKQLALKSGKFGQRLAIAVRTSFLKPLDGYNVCDDFSVAIVHGAVNTDNYGSGYWTCWGVTWEAGDDTSQSVWLTLAPKEDTVSPDADLIDSRNINTQAEWQIGWAPPDPALTTSKYWLDQNTGIVYIRDDDTPTALTPITGTV